MQLLTPSIGFQLIYMGQSTVASDGVSCQHRILYGVYTGGPSGGQSTGRVRQTVGGRSGVVSGVLSAIKTSLRTHRRTQQWTPDTTPDHPPDRPPNGPRVNTILVVFETSNHAVSIMCCNIRCVISKRAIRETCSQSSQLASTVLLRSSNFHYSTSSYGTKTLITLTVK